MQFETTPLNNIVRFFLFIIKFEFLRKSFKKQPQMPFYLMFACLNGRSDRQLKEKKFGLVLGLMLPIFLSI